MKKFKESQWYGIVILVLMAILFWSVFKILRPDTFGSPDKVLQYIKTAFIYAIGGCGLYFICVMGPFDFSVGANIVLSAVVAVTASKYFGYAGLIIAPLLCGTLVGLCNGIVYMKLQISSLIVTVGLSLIYEALAIFATNGKEAVLDKNLRAFGDYPWNIVLAFSAYLICGFILRYTKFGTYVYAIGSNEVVARNMGVNVKKYKILAFTVCGFFVGIQSILTISYGTSMTSASNLASMSRNFTPLMGTFFGLAFRKYGHPIVAIVIGEIIISLMFNGFVALGAPITIQNVITGIALLMIVTMTTKPVKGLVVK
ncbi:monosaccharide ABC transporter membrane protein, CUT2 family [Butyrivibrio fibrisolvens]|uniref:Monosaccharide ABC transporter membrane protein, CUT2 family n=1 Tax=Butyrivibrio fibrisolvens TaxID=831 RepID=A0A1H9VU65_BUTFI|nr:ABC transporter permease [Butyrivibrio fibrisolvens]SES25215.1 monosaccharide ABC transporter membrane protein, CUT2 family [Butyrivibrio fibrisolvens]